MWKPFEEAGWTLEELTIGGRRHCALAPPSCFRRPFICLVAWLLFPCAGWAGAKKSGWIEVRSPHFIVDSNSGKGEAKATALQFEQIRDAMEQVLPQAKDVNDPRLTILAVNGEQSLKRLLPGYFAKKGGMRRDGGDASRDWSAAAGAAIALMAMCGR